MTKKAAYLLALLSVVSTLGVAYQEPDTVQSKTTGATNKRDDRWRLMPGTLFYSPDKNENIDPFLFNYPGFVNLHYRWSNIDPSLKTIQFGSTQELGANFVLNTNFPFPWIYYKFGSEMRYGGAGYIDIHAGFSLLPIAGAHSGFILPIPFAGISAGYILQLSGILAIELEGGGNILTVPVSPVYPYITIGLVLR